MAFNAIIHRNRPDLVEWKKLDRRQVRERIDLAFHVMEKEYGVTRLLDPEGKTFLDNHSSHTVLENSCQLHMGVSEVGGQRRVSYGVTYLLCMTGSQVARCEYPKLEIPFLIAKIKRISII